MSISVADAIALITKHTALLPSEYAPLGECIGRVLSQDVRAEMSQPPFNRSPLDGYAVRAEDTAGASAETPVTLTVVSKYYAGDNAVKPVSTGEASRIMTGSMLPEGSNCVVKQEDTDEGESTVKIYRQHKPYDNYVFLGEDFKAGDTLLPAGQYIDAASVSVVAAAGITTLNVYRRPKVTIISTGDELTTPGSPLLPGKIYDSNLYYLKSRLTEMDAQCTGSMVMPDNLERICSAISSAVEVSDLVITTGGVSVGQKDLIVAALDKLNADIIFQGVKMKPGMPTTFSTIGNSKILSLSGNPFASAVAFELFVKPLFLSMTGNPKYNTEVQTCIVDTPFSKASPGGRYIRGMCKNGHVALPDGNSNGQMFSMVGCNCLVNIKPGSGALSIGDTVEVIML